jgi:hypothetical protein
MRSTIDDGLFGKFRISYICSLGLACRRHINFAKQGIVKQIFEGNSVAGVLYVSGVIGV